MNHKAYSLIEVLIVIAIFAVLAIVSTQSIILSLSGARKSDASSRARENLQYATSVIERTLRNAEDITAATTTSITYLASDQLEYAFECLDIGSENGRIIWKGERLTSEQISLTGCNFATIESTPGLPDRVQVSLMGQAKNLPTTERSPVTVSTTIYLRVY